MMVEYCASILLNGFEVSASIGIHDFEQERRQRLLIDVELDFARHQRPGEDEIGQVLDYDFLRLAIESLLLRKHYNLQETLCHDIAGLCLDKPGVERVMVYSRKPDVYPDCESVGFRLTARR
jgi:dihydroneopterin aldolase